MKNKMISRSFAAAMATATMLSTMGLSVCAASEGLDVYKRQEARR